MEAVKQTVISVIFLGIVSAVAEMICPDTNAEKYLRYIVGGIIIIVTANGIAGFDFSEINRSENISGESITDYTENSDIYYTEAAGRNLSRTLENLLTEENISAVISSDINISENGSIYINKVTAEAENISDKEKIVSIIRNAVGEEVTVYVKGKEE